MKTKWIKQEIKSKTLEWGKTAPKNMPWEKAKIWCEKQGGRLPTSNELLTAYEQGVEGFDNDFYWTGTVCPDNHDNAVVVTLDNKEIYENNKSGCNGVRCVRDVHSMKTKWVRQEIKGKTLEWGKTAPKNMPWWEAKIWCKKQGGRLPTSVELENAYEQKVKGFKDGYYWTGTVYPDRQDKAVVINFDYHDMYETDKSVSIGVRCVRDVK